MTRLLVLAGILAVLALAACGGDDDDEASMASEEATAAEADAAETGTGTGGSGGGGAKDEKAGGGGGGGSQQGGGSGTEIVSAESQFGPVLFDSDQRAIYYFDKETSSTSECYGACAEAWPPVLTDGDPQAGKGIEGKLLGTTERDDGSAQATYDGRPLYYYVDDPAGQVLCHNVAEFGGLWLAVQPNGDPVS